MFNAGTAVGKVRPYFRTQAEVDLDGSAPLDKQPGLTAIEEQAGQVGQILAGFIDGATASVDIAIYDFRLLPGALTGQIVDAVRAYIDGLVLRYAG